MNKDAITIGVGIKLLLQLKDVCFQKEMQDTLVEELGRGWYSTSHTIDHLIQTIIEMQTELYCAKDRMRIIEEENNDYHSVMEDYSIDLLHEDELAELKALVAKWKEKDRMDDEEAADNA